MKAVNLEAFSLHLKTFVEGQYLRVGSSHVIAEGKFTEHGSACKRAAVRLKDDLPFQSVLLLLDTKIESCLMKSLQTNLEV